ncbi:Cocaine esterase [Mactra antiquata]
MMKVGVILFSLVVIPVSADGGGNLEIDTNIGRIKGYKMSFNAYGTQIKVNRFMGIPYAEPPIGKLRFEKPQEKKRMNGVYDASRPGAHCLQIHFELLGIRKPLSDSMKDATRTSNDCLYLNVFVPVIEGRNDALPVMVYIHGGGFTVGGSSFYPGDYIAALGNVIVVVIHYRVGLFGFLSTGDKNMPGNYGLFDQQLALSWVHENIAAFGGDADLVTIFGSSAGGASVIHQMMYPGNKGLFKRGIPQSGSIQNPWAFQPDPLKNARDLGKLVGCDDIMDSATLAQCFKEVSDDSFMAVYNDPNSKYAKYLFHFFLPSVDGDFLPEPPNIILHGSSEVVKERRSLFQSYDSMLGLTSMEGLMMITNVAGVYNPTNYTTNRATFENKLIPEIVSEIFGDNAQEAIRKLLTFEYTDWNNPDDDESAFYSFMRLSSDYVFNYQTIDAVKIHASAKDHKTYLYLFDAIPSQLTLPTPPNVKGAAHCAELTFLFGYDKSDEGFTAWTHPYGEDPEKWEIELSKKVIALWTNFAKSGNPTDSDDVGTEWPEYTLGSELYLNISQDFSIGKKLFNRGYNLWTDLLPYLARASDILRKDTLTDKVNQFCDKDDLDCYEG